MQSTTYVGLSRQIVLQRQMDVIANNLANASTPAFKSQQATFKEYLVRTQPGDKLSFVQDVGISRDMRPGTFSTTTNPLDLAIEGDAWLSVATPQGVRYTRAGHLQLNPAGEIVTAQGYPIQSDNSRALTVPAGETDIKITPDGTVSTLSGPIGKLGLNQFANQNQLAAESDNLFVTDQVPTQSTVARVHQGQIEEANVQTIIEMTRLLATTNSVTNAKDLVDGEHQRLTSAITTLSKTA
jgi:flagellar basal-body rod protein FlgF